MLYINLNNCLFWITLQYNILFKFRICYGIKNFWYENHTCAAPETAITVEKSSPSNFRRSKSISKALTHIIVGAVTVNLSSRLWTPPWVLKN